MTPKISANAANPVASDELSSSDSTYTATSSATKAPEPAIVATSDQ